MVIKIKREELLKLNEALDSVSKCQGTRFAYAVSKNKRKIQEEVESVRTALKPPQRVMEFEDKRHRILQQYGVKKDGRVQTDSLGNVILENYDAFNKAFIALRDEYKEDLDEFSAKREEHEAFLAEELELELHEISTKHLPKDLKAEDLYLLMPIITGDPSELPE